MIYHEEEAKIWIRKCYEIASQSPDPSTQVGCGIIIGNTLQESTLSFNGPPGLTSFSEEEWANKEYKYAAVSHAERRAIAKCAAQGLWTEGAVIVGNWMACGPCAGVIIDAGIKVLIRHVTGRNAASAANWERPVEIGDELFERAGVIIHNVYGPIPGAPKVLRGAEWYDPTSEPAPAPNQEAE